MPSSSSSLLPPLLPFPVRPLPEADLEHILRHTESLWSELNGERLFITGGTGFFGIWLLETLAFAVRRLHLDLRATVLTRNTQAFADKAPHLAASKMFTWLEGDVRNFVFPEGTFSHVVHAATAASPKLNTEHPGEMLGTIVDGTRHVLDFAVRAGCKRLLLTSSGAVYGVQPSELLLLPEHHPHAPDPANPASAYGEGKRMAELLCAIAHQQHGLACKIARCFAFIGPHLPLDGHFAVGNFLRDALTGGTIHVASDGRSVRSYLYMADLMIWLLHILMRSKPVRPYNVGSDITLSVAELASRIKKNLCPEGSVQIRDRVSSWLPARYAPEIKRARGELGLEVRIGLDEAINRTASWIASHEH